jgi:hypothetical protein
MSNRNIHALLSPGRVVLLQHPASGIIELAAVLGSPDTLDSMLAAADAGFGGKSGSFGGKAGKRPLSGGLASSSGSSAGSSGSGPERVLWLLVLHSPGPLDPPAAESTAEAEAAAAAQIGESSAPSRGTFWSLRV